jgi:hypothetical protein
MHGAIPTLSDTSLWLGALLSTAYVFLVCYLVKHKSNLGIPPDSRYRSSLPMSPEYEIFSISSGLLNLTRTEFDSDNQIRSLCTRWFKSQSYAKILSLKVELESNILELVA